MINQTDVLIVRYEDLLTDSEAGLVKSKEFFGITVPPHERIKEVVEKFSFQSQTNRENYFRRKEAKT